MKPIKTLKVSVSGIRGVVGDTLKPQLVCRFAQSFATYLGQASVVVGRDTRTSGEMVKHATVSGLLSAGVRVVDVGICPVPTVQLAVRRLRARGGVAITASHNPAQWNALKFIKGDGCFLNQYEAEELLALYHQQEFRRLETETVPPLDPYGHAVDDHIQQILERLEPATRPSIRVAVDCCNGAGSVMTPQFLQRLGCEVAAVHTTPDGRFPRPPEPLAQNLTDLVDLVKKSGAQVGFAQDADADRLAIVSEQGDPLGEEMTLALCTWAVLEKKRGPVVTNLSTSRMIDDIAARFECDSHRSRIGEVNVTEMMQEKGAVIGGEGNGGVIHPGVNLARDSFVAMTLILGLMRSSGRTISQLAGELPSYEMDKAVRQIHPHRISDLIEHLAAVYRGEKLNRLDGLKIDRDRGWIHVRPSNTEPILRVVIEAADREVLERYQSEIAAHLAEFEG